jgi:hypothetical protein
MTTAAGGTAMAMGRTATGGMTLQDEATGDTTMWHDDGDGRHNDGDGQNGDGRHDDGDGRHNDGQHNDGTGQHGDE